MTELSKFHNEPMETASRERITQIQSERLRAIVGHVYESNAIYRRLFDEKGIRPRISGRQRMWSGCHSPVRIS